MKILKHALVAVSACAVLAPMSFAQDAASISELLRMVEQGRVSEAAGNRDREARFRANQADQERLLAEARAAKQAAENKSEGLETTFAENEDKIAELEVELEVRLGDLKELFGVIQQAAADASGDFEGSLVSFQYPERLAYLSRLVEKMGSTSELASMTDIEKLWFELMREVAETGKVVKLQAQVGAPDGESSMREVVRVGGFSFVSDGRYLNYIPETQNLTEFGRQPDQARYTGSTSALVSAQPGSMVKFGLDPTRGQILASLVDKPNLKERIDQGGIVGYVILALGALALVIALERLLVLTFAASKVTRQTKTSTISEDNALGRVLAVAESNKGASTETLELKLGEGILKETPRLNRGLVFLKIISVVAPLLGLLGTVTGMIKTFQEIMLYGTGDASLMAGGISQALVTTAQGLIVAIPTVLLHTFVSGRAKKIVHILQEQSAGIIAERSEKTD